MALPAVLHVAQPTTEGVARVVADLVVDQARRGWRVGVACPSEGDLLGWIDGSGADHLLWRAGRSSGPSIFNETRRLRRVIETFSPDLVHLHSSKAGLAGRLYLRGRLPTLFQPHAWSFEAVAGPVAATTRAWERFAARWAIAIVCVSEEERRTGEAVGIRARWQVVPNGIDLSRFSEADGEAREQARRSLGFPTEPTVVCVGRIGEQKGQDILLEAWPGVIARVPTAKLYLVGDGPQRLELEARGVPRVVFLGRRSDVAKILAAADVVAMPSRWEGCSLAMLEALARGRSVVAFDVPGAREAIGTEAGKVVPNGDTGAFVDALSERLSDPGIAEHEGANGRRRMERSHDLTRTTETVASLYSELLAQVPDTST